MTEAKWLAATDPKRMLRFLTGRRPNDRKLWLFAVACHRRVWPDLEELAREATEVAERYADGRATEGEMRRYNTTVSARIDAAFAPGCQQLVERGRRRSEAKAQADLIREIFGNPFRPVTIAPPGSRRTCWRWRRGFTRSGRSTACRSWPTRFRTRAVTATTSFRTVATRIPIMYAGAGS